jgi:hypothetical protein
MVVETKSENLITKIDVFREKMAESKTDFLIDQILPTNTIDMLVAEPKSKKSFLAITMAGAVASGRPWLKKFTTKHMPVLYLNLEVAPEYFNEMINKTLGKDYTGDLYIAHNNFQNPFKFRLSISKISREQKNAVGKKEYIGLKEISLSTQVKETLDKFKEEVPSLGLIIVDSFRRSTTINENDSGEVSIYFDMLNKIRAMWEKSTILIIHHTVKSSVDSTNPGSVRGSGDILAGIDNLYQLIPQQKASAKGREIITLRTDYGRIKLNDGYSNGIDIGIYDCKDDGGDKRLLFNWLGQAYEGTNKVETAKNKIKEVLSEKGSLEFTELEAEVMEKGVSRSTFKNALNNLKEINEVVNNLGYYELG